MKMERGQIQHLKHGNNFKKGPFCVIEDHCEFGNDVTIGPFCHFKDGTKVGNNVKIDSGVKSSGDNVIEDVVTIRYDCILARHILVKKGAFLSPGVKTIYTEHDRTIPGNIVIGEYAFIGTGAVIDAGVKIGAGVVIGAMSFVNKDCLEPAIYAGIPVRKIKDL